MAYTYEQLSQLPEFASLQTNEGQSYATHGFGAYDPTAVQSALSGYTMLDPTKLTGTDVFSKTIGGLGYDMGGQRAVKTSDLDYYKNLASTTQQLGVGSGDIQSLSGPFSGELKDFSVNANFPMAQWTTESGQRQRFVPWEATRELASMDPYNTVGGTREFLTGRLPGMGSFGALPEQYRAQLTGLKDYAGTDYSNIDNPLLGYVLNEEQVPELWKEGVYDWSGEALRSADPGNPYAAWPNQMHNVGDIQGLAGARLQDMTPEVRKYLLDRGIGDYELMAMTNGNGTKPSQDANFLQSSPEWAANFDRWKNIYNNADLFAIDPDNPYNMLVGDKETGYFTKTHPLMTNSGIQNLYGHLAAVNQGAGDEGWGPLGSILMSAVGGMLLGPAGLGFGQGAAGAITGAANAFGTGGDPLSGALTGGLGGMVSSGLSGVTGGVVDSIAEATGLPVSTISSALNPAAGALITSGGDIEKALAAGAGGLAAGAIGSADIGGAGSLADTMLPGAASTAIKTAIGGGDLGDALGNYLAGSALNNIGGITSALTGGGATPTEDPNNYGYDYDTTTNYDYPGEPFVDTGTTTPDTAANTGGTTMDEDYVDTLGDWPVADDYNDTLGDWPTAEDPNNYGYDYDTGSGVEFADPAVVDLFDNAGTPGFNDLGQSYDSLAEELFNRAGTPGYTQYGDPATGLDWLLSYLPNNPLGALSRLLTRSSGSSTTGTGLPGGVVGGGLGLLAWLAQRDQRSNQSTQNAGATGGLRSAAFNAPLAPTQWAGPQARNVMGATPSVPRQNVTPIWNQPIRRAQGGLTRMANNAAGPSMGGYASGGTKGQDDKVPALLSDGEYVLDADIVAALGDGNNAAGAAALDKMRENIRRHKRSAPANKIPPKAKAPEVYMKGARK